MLKQTLQQKLQQKLSPNQILVMKLIEVPTAQLEQRIKEELEENPVLEIDPEKERRTDDEDETEETETQEETNDRDTSIEEYLAGADIPAYKLKANNYSPDDKQPDIPFSEGISFYEHLQEQIGLQNFDEQQEKIARYIIGNIDEDGYLRRTPQEISDDLAFATNIEVDIKAIEEILSVIQHFDPAGVGAMDLRECLLLQLRVRDQNDKTIKLATAIVDQCFEEFTKKHYDKIIKKLRIEEDELKVAIEEILRLNPKPGSGYSGSLVKASQHIIPDFIIDYEDNRLSFHLNSRNEPELKISTTYREMLQEFVSNKANQTCEQREAAIFVKQKLDSAKWFIDALRQRRNTLTLVMKAILDYQGEYFIDGDETKLKPMILKDVATITNLDPSTISRVSNSKYVQTPFGIFPLKYFFSEKIQNTEGEDISSREVKKILEESIAAEDKRNPLTDEKLVEILAAQSYNIARRTIAKYREQLGIPVARLRKEL